MMKTFRVSLLMCCIQSITFVSGQSDSVYFHNNNKLISEIQIISPQGQIGIRENYSYFKQTFWLQKTDTILLSILADRTNLKNKKAQINFEFLPQCDSAINHIRNSSTASSSSHHINEIVVNEIGRGNAEFQTFLIEELEQIQNRHLLCSEEFNVKIKEQERQEKKKIQEIKASKEQFFNHIVANSTSISSNMISDFIISFDECDTDYKVMEIIILNNSQVFMDLVNEMTEDSFNDLLRKMNFLPNKIDADKLKNSLKKTADQTKRTKMLIRKTKSRDWV